MRTNRLIMTRARRRIPIDVTTVSKPLPVFQTPGTPAHKGAG
ncbi:hypothetical protein HMPREF0307_00097 [Corynebacterium sp. DNF00584]|nr:hypothetical protein HMPREF0307_00097 [Corynebacterium sp. DNF00584]